MKARQNRGRLFLLFSIALALPVFVEVSLGMFYSSKPDSYIASLYQDVRILEPYRSPYIYQLIIKSPSLYSQNNLGVRGDATISEKPTEGTVRILSYGDSVAHGFAVITEETYANRLETILNAQGTNSYEVLNMARGSSPSIYSFFIQQDIEQLKPTRVLLQIELENDISDEAHIEYAGVDTGNLPINITRARYYPGWQTMPPISPQMRFWEMLYTRKALFDFQRKLDVTVEGLFPNPIFSKSSDTYYYNLGYDKRYLTKDRLDTAFLRMFQTIKGIHSYLSKRNIDFLLIILPAQHKFYSNQYQPGAIRLYDQAIKQAQSLQIPYIDLAKRFEEHDAVSLYYDFVHPTRDGHKLIAEEIASFYATREPLEIDITGNP